MSSLPVRGDAVRRVGLPIPPRRMPLLRAGRPLKRWRYLGVYTAELMLCVGDARVAGLPQRWWAVALPDGRLFEHTTSRRSGVRLSPRGVSVADGPVSIELVLGEPAPVEVVSAHGRSYIWTAKRAPVTVRGRVGVGSESWELDGAVGFVDDSAGYHARHTAWRWSAGLGLSRDGRRVAWNLVDGIHDSPVASERTLWVDGVPHELEALPFGADLRWVGGLRFQEWSRREHSANRGPVRSRYRQPFGSFHGELPGGLVLAEGYGVMEDHEAWW